MALAEKYTCTFESLGGDTYDVAILVDGYVGSPVTIKMGTPPFTLSLTGEDDDRFTPVKPQVCTLNLLSETQLQYADLITSTEQTIKVVIQKDSNPFWEGWVLPDQYEEPYDQGANYIVSLQAVCGLERLDFYEWDQTGRVSIVSALATILAKTGLTLNIETACNVYDSGMTQGAAHDPLALTYIYKDRFYEDDGTPFTYRRVLEEILKYAGCQIRQCDGKWTVVRIAELTGSHFRRVYNSAGVYQFNATVNPSLATTFEEASQRLSFIPGAKSQRVTLYHGTLGNLLPGGDFNYSGWLTSSTLRDFTAVGLSISRVVTNVGNRQYGALIQGTVTDLTESAAYLVNNSPKAITAGGGNALMFSMTYSTKGLDARPAEGTGRVYVRFRIKVGTKYLVGESANALEWSSTPGLVVLRIFPGKTVNIQFVTPALEESGTVELRLLRLGDIEEIEDFPGITVHRVQIDALLGGEWQFESDTLEAAISTNTTVSTEPIELLIGEAPTATHLSATTLSGGALTEGWVGIGGSGPQKRHRILLQDVINQRATARYKIRAVMNGFANWFNTTTKDSKTFHINGGTFNPNMDQWEVTLYEITSSVLSATVTQIQELAPATETGGVGGDDSGEGYINDWSSIIGKPANDTQWSDELGLAPGFFTFEAEELARVRGFVAVDALALWADVQSLMDRKAEAGHSILAGTGLSGGGLLTADRTLSLANTAVTPGTYGSTIQAPEIIIDAQGRITSAVNRTIRDASPSQSGVVSTGTQRFAGSKIFELGVFLEAAAVLESLGATVGFSGAGLAVRKVTDEWKMDIDSLLIRGALFATELIVNQISAVNGSDILSPGRGKIETYTPGAEPFDVTVSDPQGGNFASFAVGDIVLIQQVRPNDSAVVKRIIKEVDGVSGRTVSLISTAGAPTDVGTIEPGDVMVSIGNVSNANRRASIYRSVTDANNPFVRVFTGVDSWGDWLHQDRISLAYGNLNGSYGYETSIYGFAAGDYSGANITMDPTNGLRLRDGSLVLAQLSGDTFTIGDLNNYFAFNASLATLALNINGALNLNETDGLTLEVSATETTDGAKAVKWMSGGDVYSSMLGVDVTDGLVGGLWYSDFGLTMYAAGLGLGLDAGWRLLLPSDGSGGQFPAISVHSDNANSYRTVIEMRSRDAGVALRLLIPELPLSSSGLPTGAVYVDSGTLKIVT